MPMVYLLLWLSFWNKLKLPTIYDIAFPMK